MIQKSVWDWTHADNTGTGNIKHTLCSFRLTNDVTMGSPEKYVCTLDEASLQKAREELHEDPVDRMNVVEAFRKLIQTRAPHIVCSMDASFLLRFLRVAKFSQLEALKRLEKYLKLLENMSHLIRDIDLSNPRVQAFLDTGYVVPLGFNDQGQKVLLLNFGSFDPKSTAYDKKDIFQALFGVFINETACERSIVNGFTGMMDLTTFTLKHNSIWSMDDLKRTGDMMNGGFPARFAGFYYYNHGPVWEAIFNVFAPLVKKKVRDRLVLCGSNLEAIYDKRIPMRLLPTEYLPDDYTGPNNGSLRDLINKLKEETTRPEVVARLKYETSDAFRLDESKRPKDDVPLQTFRKLNVN